MLISVVIPTFNRVEWLPGCLESVFAQTLAPNKVIVVDDGSTDETHAVIQKYSDSVCYIKQTNAGPASARNTGATACNTELIAFLDVDDRWPDDALENLSKPFIGDQSIDCVWGMTQPVEPIGDAVNRSLRFRQVAEPGYVTVFGSLLMRRSVFGNVGTVDTSLPSAEDLDWFLRARSVGVRFNRIAKVTLEYTQHGNQLSTDIQSKRSGIAVALKMHIQRRREARAEAHQTGSSEFTNRGDN